MDFNLKFPAQITDKFVGAIMIEGDLALVDYIGIRCILSSGGVAGSRIVDQLTVLIDVFVSFDFYGALVITLLSMNGKLGASSFELTPLDLVNVFEDVVFNPSLILPLGFRRIFNLQNFTLDY